MKKAAIKALLITLLYEAINNRQCTLTLTLNAVHQKKTKKKSKLGGSAKHSIDGYNTHARHNNQKSVAEKH